MHLHLKQWILLLIRKSTISPLKTFPKSLEITEKIVYLLNSFRLTSEPIALNLEVLPLRRCLEIEEGSIECIILKCSELTG